MRPFISFLIFLFLSSSAWATNWYVRDGGGTATQCTGTTNAVYPGSGSGQNCAFNGPAWVTGVDGYSGQIVAPRWVGGDTLYIDGDSDITPGTQAQYMIGYQMPGASACVTPYACTLHNVPAGTSSSNPTSIIGTGTHQPQLWGLDKLYQIIEANNNYINLKNLEITDHLNCAYNNIDSASQQCNTSSPWGNWAQIGIDIGGTGLTLTNLYVHGLGEYGITTHAIGNSTFTNVWTIGNGYGGFIVSNGGTDSVTGTLTFNQPIVEWNGCVEAYPLTHPGIDNPLNYSDCFGQGIGGYGDGLAFGATGNQNAGNWTIIGPGSISFNTQDGLDMLHGVGNGTVQVDKIRFEGNAGQQVKINALNMSLTNSLIVGDCGWWQYSAQAVSAWYVPNVISICRALGDTIVFNVTNNSSTSLYGNTILSNGNIALESEDVNSTGCNGSTVISVYNNVILGGYDWSSDSTWTSGGQNKLVTYLYNDGNNGDGGGSCGNLTWTEDYNIVYGFFNNNQGCVGAHDKCGTYPGFAAGTFPMGTAGGGASTYYQGLVGITLLPLSNTSPAIGAGVSGLPFWNTPTDYYNFTRASPPSMGGLELNSCAANSWDPCFYNSDCCSGECLNHACSGTVPGPSSYSLISGNSIISSNSTF